MKKTEKVNAAISCQQCSDAIEAAMTADPNYRYSNAMDIIEAHHPELTSDELAEIAHIHMGAILDAIQGIK